MAIKNIFVIGKTASGKTTFTNLIKQAVAEKYKTSIIHSLDDYSMLSEVFVEDDIREDKGLRRLHSKRINHLHSVTNLHVFEYLSKKLGFRLLETFANLTRSSQDNLIITEFSRCGTTAYTNSFHKFSKTVLRKSHIVYLSVKIQETFYRNRYRYENKLTPNAHCLPDQNLAIMNSGDDWEELTCNKVSGFLTFSDINVPYLTINNNRRFPKNEKNEMNIQWVEKIIHKIIDFTHEQANL